MTMPTVDTHHHPLSPTAGAPGPVSAPAASATGPLPMGSPSLHSDHLHSHSHSHSSSLTSPTESRKRPFDETQDVSGSADGSSGSLANGSLGDGASANGAAVESDVLVSSNQVDLPHPTKKPRLEDLADAAISVTSVDAVVAPPSPVSFNPLPTTSSSEPQQQPSPSTLPAPAAVSPNDLSLASSPSFSPAPALALPNPPTISTASSAPSAAAAPSPATAAASPLPASPAAASATASSPNPVEKPAATVSAHPPAIATTTVTGPPAGVYSPFHPGAPSTASTSATSSSAAPLAPRAPSPITSTMSQQPLHQSAQHYVPGPPSSLSSRGSTPDSTSGGFALGGHSAPSTTTSSAMGTPTTVKAEPPLASSAVTLSSSTSSLTSSSGSRPPSRPMSQAQYKHLLSTLRSIKRLKDAAPFTAPVDWKALNLPDYPLIIKRPMDLKTMEAKLQAKEYTLVDQVIADFDTMVDNCVRYNGEKSIYSAMARKIRQSLDKHLERLPPPDPVVTAPPVGVSAIGAGASSVVGGGAGIKRDMSGPAPTAASAAARRLSGIDFTVSAPAGSASQRKSSPGLAAFGSSVASSARSSTSSLPSAVGGGASTPGAASAVAAANAAARNQHEMDAALAVVRELFKRQYQEFAAPFLVPVDRRMYPQYYETIRQPMDFGTIRERLEAGGHYASAAQVEADCNLVFKNCFKFNPPGNPVRSMGMKLEALFKGLWANRSTMIPPLPPPAIVASAVPHAASGLMGPPTSATSSSASAGKSAAAKKSRANKSKDPGASSASARGGASASPATASSANDDEWNELYDPADESSGELFAIRSMEQSIAQMQAQLQQLKDRYLDGKRALRAAAVAVAAPARPSPAAGTGGSAKKRASGANSKASRASAAATAAARNATAAAQARQHSQQQHYGTAAHSHGRHHAQHLAPAPEVAATAPLAAPAAAAPTPAAVQLPPHTPEPPIPVTYDMKRLVSDRINNLTADLAEPVMNVLRETMALPDDQEEEVELDMNAMSDYTVYKLWELVRDEPGAGGAEQSGGEPMEGQVATTPAAPALQQQQQQQHQQPAAAAAMPPPQVPMPHGHPHHHHQHRPSRGGFMSLSAALGGGQSSDEESDDGSSSGSDSD